MIQHYVAKKTQEVDEFNYDRIIDAIERITRYGSYILIPLIIVWVVLKAI